MGQFQEDKNCQHPDENILSVVTEMGRRREEDPCGRNHNAVWKLLLQQALIVLLHVQLVHQSAPQRNNKQHVGLKKKKNNFDKVTSYSPTPRCI